VFLIECRPTFQRYVLPPSSERWASYSPPWVLEISHSSVMVNSVHRQNIGNHQCRLRRKRLTTDQIFCICQILEKKWEYSGTVHQLEGKLWFGYCPQSLRGVNVFSTVRGKYKACRWTEDCLLVSDKGP
jgi:hypothetical protein